MSLGGRNEGGENGPIGFADALGMKWETKKIKKMTPRFWPGPLEGCHLLKYGVFREEQVWGRWSLNHDHLKSEI